MQAVTAGKEAVRLANRHKEDSVRAMNEVRRSPVLVMFSSYKRAVQNRSPKTVDEYLYDLRIFFRYIIARREGLPTSGEEFEAIDLAGVDEALISSVTKLEVLEYLSFLKEDRELSARSMQRKICALRSFYKFAVTSASLTQNNPVKDIDAMRAKNPLPKYLTLEESRHLLDTVSSDTSSKTRRRDFAILVTFLNTGMRLSELVGLNLDDFDADFARVYVVGKGSKERVIYLNEAVRAAIRAYLTERAELLKDVQIEVYDKGKRPLFLSGRRQRISVKTVEYTVSKYFKLAGYEYRHLSTHKLRHTAATLMYREGGVDVRTLKDILGHEQLNTTQIYTHVTNEDMERAVKQNPLADFTPTKKKEE